MTLVELLVAMTAMFAVLGGFFFMYIAFNASGAGSTSLTQSQSSTRTVLRVLEADLRSADPLLQPVGSGFTLQADQTADQDVIAMFETTDGFSPCQTTPTPPTVPSGFSPFVVLPAPNVVWSFDSATKTLTRWSYVTCGATSPSWHAGMSLKNVVDPAGTMFALTGTGVQTSTTVVGQTQIAVCATAVVVNIQQKSRGQATAFKVSVTVPLSNQASVEDQACS